MQEELGWEFIQIYGLTETSPLLTVNRERAEWAADDPMEVARRLGRAGTGGLCAHAAAPRRLVRHP